jgi:hypothetical protein
MAIKTIRQICLPNKSLTLGEIIHGCNSSADRKFGQRLLSSVIFLAKDDKHES